MTRRIAISGSLAYDNIMVFDGHFKDHILPDRVHILNVSFLTPQLKREYGGCAANIAYNLRALGGEPVVLGAVGRDGGDCLERLRGLGVDVTHVRQLDEHFTAQAFITTDLADNQITAFHPGAMALAHTVSVHDALPAAFGIVAPNGKAAMLRHAEEFQQAKIPFLFDPGQGLPMFDGAELRALIEGATAVTVNDYECQLMCERTGWDQHRIAQQVEALIITRGGDGSTLHFESREVTIAAAAITKPVDPTGCGDAYRGGLLFGLAQGWDWLRCAQLGSVMGAIKIECQGAQNHQLDLAEVARRFSAAYGSSPW